MFWGGLRLYQAARVMAVLDRKDEAVDMLRRALQQGASPADWHVDRDLRLPHGFAPYEELVPLRG